MSGQVRDTDWVKNQYNSYESTFEKVEMSGYSFPRWRIRRHDNYWRVVEFQKQGYTHREDLEKFKSLKLAKQYIIKNLAFK